MNHALLSAGGKLEAGTVPTIQPIILAGGSGTRLWPLSREHYPKQLINVLGDESLLTATVRRLEGLSTHLPVAPETVIVCGENHRFITAELLRQSGHSALLMLESVGRNTAPALTVAALSIAEKNSETIMVAMPADQAMTDDGAFHRAALAAAQYAAAGAIVTMGIVPTRAETGFGYIKIGAQTGNSDGHLIERFVEKPELPVAEQYLESGQYWWNSGIFVVRASIWLEAIKLFQPAIYEACVTAFTKGRREGEFYRLDAQAFATCPSDSIDYAVMEKVGSESTFPSVVVPLDAGWSDVGSWDSVWQMAAKDDSGNVARGRVIFVGAESTFAHSEGRLIACVGTDNLIVVETPDAILVANRNNTQEVKAVVAEIKAQNGLETQNHRKVHRPWGYYDSIDSGDRFQVKRIVVKPGGQLSLQMHHHRAEHWIVVRGTAKVTRGDEAFILTENQSTYIPVGVTHRLENPGKLPLEMIEVQSGAYLGEDDILRFDDTYGRT